MNFDKDLQSIQQARNLMKKAVDAQKEFSEYSQEEVTNIIKAITEECVKYSRILAEMAHDETGFGKPEDKVIKNLLGSQMTYDYIKDMKTVGIINERETDGIIEVAVPVGVVVALIPSTNPTSTTMYKALISLKAGNAIVISPHPSAKNCILKTVEIIIEAAIIKNRFDVKAIWVVSSIREAASFVYSIKESSILPTNIETPYPKATPEKAVIIPRIGFLSFIKYIRAAKGIRIAYPTSFINDEIVAKNINMNVRTFLETFFSFRLVIVANSPVDSAIVKPNSDTSNVPKGAKLIKFLVALLIINFIPSKLKRFSTTTRVGSSSLVFIFIML